MSFEDVTQEDVERANADALAVMAEWRGAHLSERLAAFGLSPDAVLPLLAERIAAYGITGPDVQTFSTGFVEGMCTTAKLRLESGDAGP